MRTTIQIDDSLHEMARRHAVAKGKTFTALVEEALREKLLSRKTKSPVLEKHVVLKTVGGNGVLPGIELDNNAALLDQMEQD